MYIIGRFHFTLFKKIYEFACFAQLSQLKIILKKGPLNGYISVWTKNIVKTYFPHFVPVSVVVFLTASGFLWQKIDLLKTKGAAVPSVQIYILWSTWLPSVFILYYSALFCNFSILLSIAVFIPIFQYSTLFCSIQPYFAIFSPYCSIQPYFAIFSPILQYSARFSRVLCNIFISYTQRFLQYFFVFVSIIFLLRIPTALLLYFSYVRKIYLFSIYSFWFPCYYWRVCNPIF